MNGKQIYYFIGQLLSNGLEKDHPDSIIQDLKSPEFDWNKLIAAGSNHLVLQTIYCKLRERDQINLLPGEIHKHLKYIYDLNYKRNSDILKQVNLINQALNKEGIFPMYIKGVGNIIDGVYSDIGERIMLDIDLLVNKENLDAARNILIQIGYSNTPVKKSIQYSKAKHLLPLIKEGGAAAVEIHRYPVEFRYRETLSEAQVWKNKKLFESCGKCFVMSDRHKILHNFIHAQLEHHGHAYARTYIRNLYDLLLFSGREDIGVVFNQMNQYRSKAICYMKVMEETFKVNASGKTKLNVRNRLFLARYKINLVSRFVGLITYYTTFILRSYIFIPVRTLGDRELRRMLPKKLFDKDFYKRHYNSLSRFYKNRLHIFL